MFPADLPTGVVLTNAVLQKLPERLLNFNDIEVSVLRLDLLDQDISGNKWFKLQYYHQELQKSNKSGFITFGGPYSNHLLAVAKHCKNHQLKATAIIRGNYFSHLSPTLLQLKEWGTELIFASIADYANPASLIERYAETYQNYVWIPEGGSGNLGIQGAALISHYYDTSAYTHIACAVGTGTTMAGLLSVAHEHQTILGVSALKIDSEENELKQLFTSIKTLGRFELHREFHEGGYGKSTNELVSFMNQLYEQTGIPTDIVYTGKLFKGILSLIANAYFQPKSKLLLIHSGGLQGNRSLEPGSLIF